MAGKKENLKSLFTNTRTRVIILFTAILLIVAILIGFFKLRSSTQAPLGSEIAGPPNITSVPGQLEPSPEVVKLQEQQNVSQANEALKSGKSALPTLVRMQSLGEGTGAVGSPEGKTGVGFKTLANTELEGNQKSLWLQSLQNSNCSKTAIQAILDQGGQMVDLRPGCSCLQLKNNGYLLKDLKTLCDCKELRQAGFGARDLKDVGFTVESLRICGYSACEMRGAGFSAGQMKEGGYSDGELKGSGFNEDEIAKAGGIPDNMSVQDIHKAGCDVTELRKLRQAGVSAAAIRRINGCTTDQLRAAGYTAKELKDAGFTAADLKKAGFPEDQLQAAGYSKDDLDVAKKGTIGNISDCSPASLQKARANGVSALTIRKTLGCSAKDLKAAGYTAKDLMDAGFTAADLAKAGFSPKELKDAGFSAKDLLNAGIPAKTLKDLGYSLRDLKDAGLSPGDLKNLGFAAAQLKAAGHPASELKKAGFNPEELKAAGFPPEESQVAGLAPPPPVIITSPKDVASVQNAANANKLQDILARQNQQQAEQQAEQKYQQKIQQRTAAMLTAANQSITEWKKFNPQQYVPGNEEKVVTGAAVAAVPAVPAVAVPPGPPVPGGPGAFGPPPAVVIKTGDILFAVIDTAVNTDEPGPILATIVSGKLKGSKLIGSFNLPPNANKMIISFNTLSMPGAPKTTSISAFAIDPNTGRTALSSRTNHHYLMRYGSLFASSFLEGFGNAFQAANTAITIGGTGGGNNITVQSGIGQSALENAVIGLATVGKSWGQQAQLLMNRPTTILVCAGTGIGVLFTQDVALV